MVKRRCAGSNLPFNALSSLVHPCDGTRTQSINGNTFSFDGVVLIAPRVIFNHYIRIGFSRVWKLIRLWHGSKLFLESDVERFSTSYDRLRILEFNPYFYSLLEKNRSTNNYSSLPKERRDFPTFLGGVYRSLPRESTLPLLSRPQISRYLYSHANLDNLRFDKLPDIFDLQGASPLPYLSRLIYFP